MKTKHLLTVFLLFLSAQIALAQSTYQWKSATSGGYPYRYVTNDPSKSRFYTLKNGLTVILSQNKKSPSIDYRMTVRAGSNTDPRNATGLAHYLEHMLFKGTDKFGTLNYAKEKPLLDKIDALYEQYNKTTDPEKRKEIYKEIDKVSNEASNYSIAGEYEKMMASMGGVNTNAATSTEFTVYVEDFASNAVDKFLELQAERFRNPVLRLFHTELEAVYEEKNGTLDSDNTRLDEKLMSTVFPTHNYGQQTTIGTIEHLKNPSLVEIRNYYNKYYVPNNMAAIFVGDFEPDEMIKKVDKAFSYMKPNPKLALYNPAPEKPLTSVKRVEVLGPNSESMNIAYRGYPESSKENLYLKLISLILSNEKTGLIDLNLKNQQKVFDAYATYYEMKDYGFFVLAGKPKEGQTLAEVEKLLLAEIENVKKGNFDPEMLRSIVSNQKLNFLEAFELNSKRINQLFESFVNNHGKKWDVYLQSIEQTSKITKQELVAFANKFFANNYVVANKLKGIDEDLVKVEKPTITPVNTNAGQVSEFTKNNLSLPVSKIQPSFVDFSKSIQKGKAGSAEVLAVKNTDNSIFRMTYRFELGSQNYKLLPIASKYLSFLSTDKYSSEELSKKLFTMASNYSLSVGPEETFIKFSGLQENFDETVALIEHIFKNIKSNEPALEELKNNLLKERENAKTDRGEITYGLISYAVYGANNPFNDVLSDEEIKAIKSDDLIYLLKNMFNYKHVITYFGPKDSKEIGEEIAKLHFTPADFTPHAPAKKFVPLPTLENKVVFADYEMIQAEIFWLRNAGAYDPKKVAVIDLFNNYFGGGMGSVVFQTLRESKALAYSTSASYDRPSKQDEPFSFFAYIGSQADKFNEAAVGMNELLTELPQRENSFDGAKLNIITNLETTRTLNDDVFYKYFAEKNLGSNVDSDIEKYNKIKELTFNDVNNFHKQELSGKPFTYAVIGSEKRVKMEDLQKFGPVKKLTLEELFGY